MDTSRGWEISHAENSLEGKTIQDFLYFEGMYNPVLRFAFTNTLEHDFVSYWGGKRYIVKPGDTVKLPHYLAVKFTKEIVDQVMQEQKMGMSLGVPAMRKPFEDKVLSILPPEEGSELEVIKQEFVDQVLKDASKKPGVPDEPVDTPELNFEDLRKKNFSEAKKK